MQTTDDNKIFTKKNESIAKKESSGGTIDRDEKCGQRASKYR